MDDKLIHRILHKYGLAFARPLEPQKGYRNTSQPVLLTDGKLINLILYKAEPDIAFRIKNANHVSDFLADSGLPTRRTIGRTVRLTGAATRYCALYSYLPGHTIPWEAYTMEHLKTLGGTMSRMHSQLRTYQRELPSVVAEYTAIMQRVDRYFAGEDVRTALHTKLRLQAPTITPFLHLLWLCQHLPEQQALHMDFVRGNILFDGTRISGIIDFEKAAYGPAAFDAARTVAFLLVDCKYKDEAKVRKYFLTSGYNKRGPVPLVVPNIIHGSATYDTLERLIDMFLLHDFYKFLRHNPYEHLLQNEHFVRTRDLLVRRQVIRYNQDNDRVVIGGKDGDVLEKATDFAE